MSNPTKHSSSNSLRLLVVERDPGALASLLQSLKGAGYQVFGSRELQRPVQTLRKYRPDVIVIDPSSVKANLKGILTAAMRGHRQQPVRVFALCRLPYDQYCQEAAAYNNVKVITLPMPIGNVITAIKSHLSAVPIGIKYGNGLNKIMHDAVQTVLGAYGQQGLLVKHPNIKEDDRLDGQILAFVTLSGFKFLASVVVCFDQNFAVKFARAMIGDTAGTQQISPGEQLDVAGEMANQIAGALQAQLIAAGYVVNIGLPNVVSGNKLRFIHPGRNDVVMIGVGANERGNFLGRLFRAKRPEVSVEFCFDDVA